LAYFERHIGDVGALVTPDIPSQERDIFTRALTHKSYSHEARQQDIRDNETFEFLGDSVLGFVIGDLLFRRFPAVDEGALSKIKAYLVSANSLAEKAREYGMGEVIYLGVGEEKSGGRKKESLLANLFEAMIAAIYLDGGIEPARELIERSFVNDLETIDAQDLLFHDYKTALQELVLEPLGSGTPASSPTSWSARRSRHRTMSRTTALLL